MFLTLPFALMRSNYSTSSSKTVVPLIVTVVSIAGEPRIAAIEEAMFLTADTISVFASIVLTS